MLRSTGLSEKVLLLGIDGLDPKFSRKMVDEGHIIIDGVDVTKLSEHKREIGRASCRERV